MKKAVGCVLLVLLVVAGCTTYPGVKPESPAVPGFEGIGTVEDLQPTLSWRPSDNAGVTYDLVVYEGIKERYGWMSYMAPGREVYYREGIVGTKHKLEIELKPDTQYFWSVRTRSGDNVSSWSLYHQKDVHTSVSNAPFTFRTPKATQ